MSAMPVTVELPHTSARPDSRARVGTSGARQPRIIIQVGAALVAMLLLALAVWQLPHPFGATSQPEITARPMMPAQPVAGVLTMVIPAGAAADQQQGGTGYEMPAVISLDVGDTIVIRNDDDAPHMILYAFLKPGESDTRTFTAPGSETYSSGCGLHAASYHSFTTIFIKAKEPGAA